MNQIKNYDFVDCLLIDFSVNKYLTTIELISEVYFPLIAGKRKKGSLKVILEDIKNIDCQINSEFKIDLLGKYNKDGDDQRANEVYSIKIEKQKDDNIRFILNSLRNLSVIISK